MIDKMKRTLLFAALTLCLASAFAPLPAAKLEAAASASMALHGWFDQAFHGGGSAKEEDLDEQWATQQAILAARRSHDGPNKEHLHHKYEGGVSFSLTRIVRFSRLRSYNTCSTFADLYMYS